MIVKFRLQGLDIAKIFVCRLYSQIYWTLAMYQILCVKNDCKSYMTIKFLTIYFHSFLSLLYSTAVSSPKQKRP